MPQSTQQASIICDQQHTMRGPFLDLPPELRVMVYESLFEPARRFVYEVPALPISPPGHYLAPLMLSLSDLYQYITYEVPPTAINLSSLNPPPIAQIYRLLRKEAIPVFVRTLKLCERAWEVDLPSAQMYYSLNQPKKPDNIAAGRQWLQDQIDAGVISPLDTNIINFWVRDVPDQNQCHTAVGKSFTAADLRALPSAEILIQVKDGCSCSIRRPSWWDDRLGLTEHEKQVGMYARPDHYWEWPRPRSDTRPFREHLSKLKNMKEQLESSPIRKRFGRMGFAEVDEIVKVYQGASDLSRRD